MINMNYKHKYKKYKTKYLNMIKGGNETAEYYFEFDKDDDLIPLLDETTNRYRIMRFS